jgi:replicative DNA helicase Mcm
MTISSPTQPINPVQKFEDFYRLFEETPGEYKYQDQIKQIDAKGGNTLTIFYEDLLSFSPKIAEKLQEDPESLLEDAIEAFKNVLKFQSGGKLNYENYFVEVATKDEKSTLGVPIRGLRAKNIDKLVWLKGITIRSSAVRPRLRKATFECMVCGVTFEIIQLTSKVKWPRFCINKSCKAKAKSDFRLITKQSEFVDWQSITIQEIPEDLPPGRMPRSVQAILKYDLVDSVKPGDRVHVMGIFKSVLATSLRSQNSTLFKTYIEVNYIDPEEKSDQDIDISKEEKEEILKLAKEPMIQKKIARSIAPTIYGRDDLKMACALSLFGGTKKKKPGGGYKRGDIHILFVGDPGTGKSVHGDEKIYVGQKNGEIINWNIKLIGDYIDKLIKENKKGVIKKNETELLRLKKGSFFTYSLNQNTLKTQKTKVREVSRHQADRLVKIRTKTGRSVLATPNHSFTTIKDGKLEVLEASQLHEDLYLPIARKLKLPEEYKTIDISTFFNKEDLVYSNSIKENIILYNSGKYTLNKAAKQSTITEETLTSYKNDPSLNLRKDWIRSKYDTTWIPSKIKFNSGFGRIVGFFLAEGDVIKNSIRITNYSNEIIDLIEEDFKNIFKRVSRYDKDKTFQFHNASLAKVFKKIFGTGAENKKLPNDFFFTPKNFRSNLLAAYFSGDGSIEKDGLYIGALTKTRTLAGSVIDLLATFGIFGTLRKKIIKSGKYKDHEYYKIILTGEEVIKFYKKIGFLSSNKQKRLIKVIKKTSPKSRYQSKDIIPNFGTILKKITTDLELKQKRNTWQGSLMAELRGKTRRQRAGRAYLYKKVCFFEKLYKEKNKKYGRDIKWLKTLTNSDILWDKIEEIEILNETTNVYDIGTKDGHFILADGNLIVHNSEILKDTVDKSPRGLYTSGKGSTAVGLTAAVIKDADTGQMNLEAGAMVLANGGIAAIDEFDKMDSADRSALHEAMEQQSYHPNFEITFSDKSSFKIGSFVNHLFKKYQYLAIEGKDCEILNSQDLNYKILSTDFKNILEIPVHRVSRHKAPKSFYKIQYSNGREIIVTPEHPLFIINEEGEIDTIDASNVKSGVFVPGTRKLKFRNSQRLKTDVIKGRKEIVLPQYLNPSLSSFLGYFITEGYSYFGSAAEIGLSSTDEKIIEKMIKIIEKCFGTAPIDYSKENHTIRLISITVYDFLKQNFPELMCKRYEKRIPPQIFGSDKKARKSFLIAAFEGDGGVESNAIAYYTSSKDLANDFQDLLLTFNIHSRIFSEKYYFGKHKKKSRIRYKVYIQGDSLIKFLNVLFPKLKSHKQVKKILKKSKQSNKHHDLLPASIAKILIKCLKMLGLINDGYINQHLNNNNGITQEVINKYLMKLKNRIEQIKSSINSTNNIKEFRKCINYSQAQTAELLLLKRGNIDYSENGGYTKQKSSEFLRHGKYKMNSIIEKVENQINYIQNLQKFRWLRIKKITKIPNKGKYATDWVYDVTIEPTENFISKGLVLHNTISIAKAGIVATLKAETAVISAANPHSGRYDIYKTPTQNIRLPPSLLSRFDLIFVVIDRPDRAQDAQMAEYILQAAMASPDTDAEQDEEETIAPISHELLKKYIKYAKRNFKPLLTNEAKERIKSFYLELRGEYESENAIVSILARNLDGLVRLSEAYAKMALREKVLKEDVEEIIKLFKRYLKDTGYDESTGKIDMDRIFVGESRSKLNKLDTLMTRLKEIFEENKWKMLERKSIIQILELEENLDREFIKNAIDELLEEGTLYSPKVGYIKFTNKEP